MTWNDLLWFLDIDECVTIKPCLEEAVCADKEGSFTCTCPDGFTGDGKKDGAGCTSKKPHYIKTCFILNYTYQIQTWES